MPARYPVFAILGPVGAFVAWIAILYVYGMIGAGVTPVDAARRFATWMTALREPMVIFWLAVSAIPASVSAKLSGLRNQMPEDRQAIRLACALAAILLISPWTTYYAVFLYRSNWLAFCFTFAGSTISFTLCAWLSRAIDRFEQQPDPEVAA